MHMFTKTAKLLTPFSRFSRQYLTKHHLSSFLRLPKLIVVQPISIISFTPSARKRNTNKIRPSLWGKIISLTQHKKKNYIHKLTPLCIILSLFLFRVLLICLKISKNKIITRKLSISRAKKKNKVKSNYL